MHFHIGILSRTPEPLLIFRNADRLVRDGHVPHRALPQRQSRASRIHTDVQARDDFQLLVDLIVNREFTAAHTKQRGRATQHRREQFAQFKFARQIGERVEQCLLFVGAASLGGERARTPNGDTRLRRSRRQNFQVVFVEGVRLGALDHEHAKHLTAGLQRHVDF